MRHNYPGFKPFPCKNTEATVINPHSLVKVVDFGRLTDETTVIEIAKPTTGTRRELLCATGSAKIPASGVGTVFLRPPFFLRINASSSTISTGVEAQWKDATYEVERGIADFVAMSDEVTIDGVKYACFDYAQTEKWWGVASGNITAASGSTLGSGNVTVYTHSGTTESTMSITKAVLNPFPALIPSATKVQFGRLGPTGQLQITAATCETS